MKYNPQIHHRSSIRLQGYDYSQPGAYFLTIVTWKREELFGKIFEGKMQINDAGYVAQSELRKLSDRFTNTTIENFVIMPNHVHAIIMLSNPIIDAIDTIKNGKTVQCPHGQSPNESIVRARQEEPSQIGKHLFASPLQTRCILPKQKQTIGTIVGAYKSTVARLINGLRHTTGAPIWQRNYYDHIIRNEAELNHVWDYIDDNPRRWEEDQLFHS